MHNADHEQIAGIIAEFLRTNGIDAQRGLAKGIGATSGIPEAIKTVGLAIKVGKAISSFLAKRARRNVRKSMALVTVTLQSTVVPATAGYPYTALQAVELVAILVELSSFLRQEYPLIEFRYEIAAAKGNEAWVSVVVIDDVLSYGLLFRLMKKISAKKTQRWTMLSVTTPKLFPWGWIKRDIKDIAPDEWECRDPRNPSPIAVPRG